MQDYLHKYNRYIKMPDGTDSNFKYIEFIRSDVAMRYGIDNEPSPYILSNIQEFVWHLGQPVRDEFGPIRVTSGYRCPELCLEIGSSTSSNHTQGTTADMEPVSASVKLVDMLNFIHNKCEYKELIAEFFPHGWIHGCYQKNYNNRSLKLKDNAHNYDRVSIDYINSLYKQ